MTNARGRMMARILNLDADEDEEGRGKGSHGNTRLPYGLCEEFGIDTTGFSPTDCWKALQGKGVDPKAAYSSLQKEGTIKPYASEVKASNNAKMTEKNPRRKRLRVRKSSMLGE
ncbi:MAG: hypothetical protein LUD47_07695 [Clostridia bacterium]|nr:hypothetical protein [Clostridia bacterium]